MKKITYSVVLSLILSSIFALIFPTWLLKRDMQWTYLSHVAHVDIAFVGSLKNGRVWVGGADLQTSQPKRLSCNNFQGTVVEFPISYRNKSYKIKIIPHADECGEDASLVLTFRGMDIRKNNERKPAWVTFRNIAINGQNIAQKQKVWHDKPFILKYPYHASEIALSLDVHKPLKASDFSIIHVVLVFTVFLLLSLFLAPIKRISDHTLSFINKTDIVKVLFDSYRNIDPVYRRSFWIIFGILSFAFGFHTIQFMWGNHDWALQDRNHGWLEAMGIGRYMVSSIKVPLSNGIYLPLFYDLMTFVVLAINAVLLCRYWCLKKRVVYFVLCGLVLTSQPFTLCMVYYVNMIPEVFIGVTCALVALLLSEKIASDRGTRAMKIVYSLIAIILVNCSLAIYPVHVTTIAVLFVGRLLIQSFAWSGAWQQLKFHAGLFMTSAINIILGITFYKLVITFIFPIQSFYNTDTLPLKQMPKRIGVLFKQCFHQLYEYNYPFISQWILWVFLGFAVILALYICCTGNFKQRIVRLFLLFSALFATQTAMIIAATHLIDGRVELFGLVFFEMLVMVIVFTRFREFHNLWIIIGACVVFASIINDLDCLRVWKLGFDAEKMFWNRVLARLEIQRGFIPTRKYDIVQIGWSISMRPRFYAGSNAKFVGSAAPILIASYDAGHYPFIAQEFYYPTRFRGKAFSPFHRDSPDYVARLKRLYQAGILQNAEVWPKPNGLIVWEDIILFVTDGRELERYKKQFERELGGNKTKETHT